MPNLELTYFNAPGRAEPVRVAIDEVLFDLEALQDTNDHVVRAEVSVDAGPLSELAAGVRLVFARRE